MVRMVRGNLIYTDLNGVSVRGLLGGLLKSNHYPDRIMRLNALFMLVLVASMSGSIAYTNISTHPDMYKMSNELISELDS